MARPIKWRKVCGLPEIDRFGPICGNQDESFVVMSVEEYETIRLIDFENMKQEECAEHMSIARTTVQGLYDIARKKIADSLVNGKTLIIKGGNYLLCDGESKQCRGQHCHRRMDGSEGGRQGRNQIGNQEGRQGRNQRGNQSENLD